MYPPALNRVRDLGRCPHLWTGSKGRKGLSRARTELSQTAQHWTNIVFIWVGFGIVAGLLARLLLPGREPAGAAGTLVIGVLGSTLGPFVLSIFLHDPKFNPIGPRGLLAAVGGSLVALVAYRLMVRRRTTEPEDEYEE